MDRDQKHFDPGFVDSVTHELTGAQVIFYLMRTWEVTPNQPVIIWCKRNDAEWKGNAIRVALSKERKERGIPRTFELRFSEPWPYTYLGIKGEAIKVERVLGTIQTQMRAAMFAMRK